jgi:hypothetical protein
MSHASMMPLLVLLLSACRCGNGSRADATEDTEETTEEVDGTEDILKQDLAEEDAHGDEPSLDVVEAHDVSPDMSTELVPVTPDRPGKECGECCKQVSYTYQSVHAHEYDVWEDWLAFRGVEYVSEGIDHIWLVDLNTLAYYNLDSAPKQGMEIGGKVCGGPAIYQDKVAYYFRTVLNREPYITEEKIVLLDLPSLQRTTVTERNYNVSEDEWGPEYIDFYGDLVVWEENRLGGGGRQEVFMKNIRTGDERLLSQGGCCALSPRIWEDVVVWWDFSLGENVMVYDIPTGNIGTVDTYDYDRWFGAVWNDIVVWFDARSGSDVYMKDLATGGISPVTTDPSTQCYWLDIHNDVVVWMDRRNDADPNSCDEGIGTRWDVYARNLATGEERNLTPFEGKKRIPRVWGKRAFFIQRDLLGYNEIFAVDLECLGFLR